jgi:NO-binding membrane sensor protein with MHYT domain
LLLYAGLAVGLVGLWLPQVAGLAGINALVSVVRYDPRLGAVSLGVAVFSAFAAALLVALRGPRVWRMLAGGAVLGAGIAGSHAANIAAVRTNGDVTIVPFGFIVSVTLALVAAGAGVWCIVALKGLRVAMLTSVGMAIAIWGMHATGLAAVRVTPPPDLVTTVAGIDPFALVGAVVLGVVVDLMLWYFTVGSKTLDDLRVVFLEGRTIEIEPWLIQEVTARTTVSVASPPRPEGTDATLPLPTRRPPGPRPTPGITPVWKTMPVWGTAAESTASVNAPGNRWHDTVRKPGTEGSTVVVVAAPLPPSLAAPNQPHEPGPKQPAWRRNTRRL